MNAFLLGHKFGSPNEPISYGYPKGYYAKPGNPWSIAAYIDRSKDEMKQCVLNHPQMIN